VTGLDPGAQFAGHRIEALIGRGGMGEVYRAVHLGLERTVALKVVAPNLAEEEGIRERFRRECRLAAAIDHPAAVAIYDSGEFDERLYVTMRLVQGPDLGRQVRRDGPLSPEWAAELSARAAEAIDAAHRHGLVHRDIKPANLLLEAAENDMRVFVGDFGLAKLLDDSTGPTRTGTWLGTVDYAAPETLAGRGAGPAADVYGLGGVLYTALTGRAPYVRDTLSGVMWAHTNDPPPQLGDLRHPATDALNDVIARAMAKEPAERFGSGADLAAALRAAVPDGERRPFSLAPAMAASVETETSAETRTAGQASTPQLPRSWPRRLVASRARLAAGAAALAALVVLAAVLLLAGPGAGGDPLEAKRMVVEPVPMPTGTGNMAVAGDTVWTVGRNRVTPVKDGKAGEALQLADQPADIAVDGDDLWVALPNSGVQRYDARKRTPIGGPIEVSVSDETRMAFGEGGLWVADPIDDSVVRIDPATSRPAFKEVDIPKGVDGPIAVGEGALWVLSAEIGDDGGIWVTPVDRSGKAGPAIHVGAYGDARSLAVGEGWVWVSLPAAGVIGRIDPETRRLSPQRAPMDSGSVALAVGAGAVWALGSEGDNLFRIDPDTAKRRGEGFPVAAGDGGHIAVDDGAVWASNLDRLSLLRLSW
jgi:Protein kinase domain